ncbi:MAG: hypothetical protein HN348_08450 [Proteobacteria bacterium]|jgi:hypothetical protein|nr:hypothetical protein [Pseudomonadota bacterium]
MRRTLLFVAALSLSSTALADSRRLCVYDPAGKTGDYFGIMEDFALEASSWGAEITLQAYTDEETASKDFDAGHCDGVLATGVRLQRFNRFPSTLEAIGALPSYDLLKGMVVTLATYESAAQKLTAGDYETVGFIPVGAAYLFVRDRSVDSVAELAGKRVATMDYDKAAPVMVDRVGAIMVPADLGSIGPKFNNGDVDVCYMSAPAYGPFELWRGLEGNGGILRAPLAQATLQLLIRRSKFPVGFGGKARTDMAGRFDEALAVLQRAEADIPDKYWVDINDERREEWDELFLSVRLKLRDEHKAYDASMLSALRKLRCGHDSTRAECVEKKE